jgi:hypothetical protein
VVGARVATDNGGTSSNEWKDICSWMEQLVARLVCDVVRQQPQPFN